MSRPIHQKLIAWASGMIEFIGDQIVPDGAIHVCTAHDKDAIDKLFGAVRKASHLIEYSDRVALGVPTIDPMRALVEVGIDFAVDLLMDWEEEVRDAIGDLFDIEWVRR